MAEVADIYEVVQRKARKAHHCSSCTRRGSPARIQPGDIYEEHRSLFDGRWSTLRICGRCIRVEKAMQALDYWGSYQEDQPTMDEIREHLCQRMHDRHVQPMLDRKWREQRGAHA